MLEEHEVVVSPGRGNGVPHPRQRILEVVCVKRHVKYPNVIRRADGGARERRGELVTRLLIPGAAVMQHQDRDDVSRHPPSHYLDKSIVAVAA